MKRGLIRFSCSILILFTLFFILLPVIHSEDAITSKVITGEATAFANASVTVGNGGPVITIHNPKQGGTYRNVSILLNYSAIDPDGVSSVWYNINGVNISLGNFSSNYTYFNTTEGGKTLFLYANDTYGLLGYNSVNFYVNNTKLIIIYETFRGSNKGNSDDFDSYTEDVLENFSDMTLENTNYGKIVWNEKINLAEDINPSDKVTTLDYNVIITNQSIFVNTTELPNLDKSATLWFYNLTFNNPRVLINGVICPEDICSNKLYSSGILRIVVASFFNFTLEETPGGGIGLGGGGGGGGGVRVNFTLSETTIKVSLKQGETKKENFTIKNTGNQKIKINLSVVGIENFIKLSENGFELSPEESKTIILDFIAREDTILDLYMGKLLVEGDGIKKEILVAVEVTSKTPLFDVKVEILEKFLKVMPGEDLAAAITIYNLGKVGLVDTKVEYIIKDMGGRALLSEEETIAIGTQTSFVKIFRIPQDAKPGDSILYVKTTYNGNVASASAWFLVKRKSFLEGNILYLIIIIIIILLVLILIIIRELRSLKKHIKSRINDDVLAISAREGLIEIKPKKSQIPVKNSEKELTKIKQLEI